MPQPVPAFAHPPAPVERGAGPRVDGELKVSGQGLYADVQHFVQGAEPSDDVTIMAIRFTEPAP